MALGLAELTFTRGMPGESQRRYEQAAELAPDDLAAADAWRSAAGRRGVATRRRRRVAPAPGGRRRGPARRGPGRRGRLTWPATPS